MLKGLFISLVLTFSTIVYADTADTRALSISDLTKQFQLAHETRDYDSITGLINWDGVRKPMRKKIEVYTSASFGLNINEITIEEVSEEKFNKVDLGRKTVKPNMPISHIMKVHFDVEEGIPEATGKDTTVYLVGKIDDHYKIAVYVKEGGSSRYGHD